MNTQPDTAPLALAAAYFAAADAARLAASFANTFAALDDDTVRQMQSDDGLHVDGFVVWHREADHTIVVWGGNDVDFDMQHLVEARAALNATKGNTP